MKKINEDNMEDLRNRLKNMQESPTENAWNEIDKSLSKKVFPFKKVALGGLVVLGLSAVLVFSVPMKKQSDKTLATTEKATEKPVSNNEKNDNILTKQTSENTLSKDEFVKSNSTEIESSFATVESNSMKLESSSVSVEQNSIADNSLDNKTIENKPITENKTVKDTTKNISNKEKKINLIVETKENTANRGKVENKFNKSNTNNDKNKIYIPNAFTPTKSTNNIFKVIPNEDLTVVSFEMQIFARNGRKVFSCKDINIGWDGRINSKIADEGVFVVVLKYEDADGKHYSQNGQLLLLR